MSDNYYFNRQVKVILYEDSGSSHTFDNLNDPTHGSNLNISFQAPFADDGNPPITTVTIMNLTKEHKALFKTGKTVEVDFRYEKSGLGFNKIAKGTIKHITPSTSDGVDDTFTFTILAGKDYGKINKIYSPVTTTKTTKGTVKANGKNISYTKTKSVKSNISFKKGTKASHIIKRIASDAKIPIAKMVLKKDKVFPKGYTVSGKPYSTIKSLVSQCKSKLYYSYDDLVVDDPTKPIDKTKTHIYLSPTTGLLGHPTLNDNDDGKPTWTINAYLLANITTGSIIEIGDIKEITGVFKVKSGEHNLDESTATTTLEVYA